MMIMNKRKMIPYAVVFITLLVWIYFKPETVLPATPKHYPSYIGYHVKNVHFDEFGNISHKMFSEKVTSYVEQNKTYFVNPRAVIYTLNKDTEKITTWQITASDGVLYDQNKLILTGDVLINNLTKDQLVQTMETQSLTMMLDIKELETDDPVHWTGPQMEEEGIGMWASFATEELIVKDKIKAVYYNKEEKND
jgi:lipopolysaccharide export system protein LptC